jgi:uncharacterized membrane protein HdeD (DUF308 family)
MMEPETGREIRQSTAWSIALGIFLIILGLIAIAAPFFASVAVGLFFGWLLIIGGILQGIYAFRHSRSDRSFAIKILLSVLALIAGILLVVDPLAGVASLTLIIGIYFFIDGIFRVIMAFQIKPGANWGWVLANGILMIILGILIWSQWPLSAVWALGLLVGIGLLFSGIATIVFAMAARSSLPGV